MKERRIIISTDEYAKNLKLLIAVSKAYILTEPHAKLFDRQIYLAEGVYACKKEFHLINTEKLYKVPQPH